MVSICSQKSVKGINDPFDAFFFFFFSLLANDITYPLIDLRQWTERIKSIQIVMRHF